MWVGNIELRGYQAEAVERFVKEPACLIAYDKQCGKTITALALVRRLQESGEQGPILIISDKTSQWTRDLALIGIPLETLHLVDRPKRTEFQRDLGRVQDGHFYQIHWAGLVPELPRLYGIRWSCVIADEAHAAKNRKSQRTKALKQLRTKYKIGLTADPSDNAPQDIWSLLNWLYPRVYTSFWRWVRKYVQTENAHGRHGDYIKFGEPINVEEFQAEVSKFYVYMSIDEIDPDQIPNKYKEYVVDMYPEQAKAYAYMVDWQMTMLGDDMVVSEYPMTAAMRLQQLAQAMGKVETSKQWRTRLVKDPATGKRVKVREQTELTSVKQVEPSPKIDRLIEVLTDDDNLGPTIIFSQYPGMIELACTRMDLNGIKYIRAATDDCTPDQAAQQFQTGQADIIIGTTGHMSESLSLNRADSIIFLDAPWNPRVRGQAEGRARVVGKRTGVRVIDIKTRDTVDFVRLDQVRQKRAWNDLLLGKTHDDTGKDA